MTMQDVIDFFKRYGRTLFAVLIVALPVLVGILKEMKKSADKRRALLDNERRKIEEMRRGTAAVNAPAIPGGTQVQRTASSELEELARRRRTQIEQTAGRVAEPRQARVQQAPQTTPVRRLPTQNVPFPQTQTQTNQRQPQPQVPQREQSPQRTQPAQRNKVKQKAQRGPVLPQRSQSQRPSVPAPMPELSRHATEAHARLHDEGEVTHRLVPNVEAPAARERTGVHLTRMQWRKAILMREVLGTPLALRDDSGQRALDPPR